MSINLDDKFKNKISITVGNKPHDIKLNDEFVLEMQHTVLVLQKIQEKVQQTTEKKFKDLSLDEQEKFMRDEFAQMKTECVRFLDKYLGDGEGKRLYDYYERDTEALGYIIGQLNDLASKKINQKRSNKRKEYMTNKR